MLNYLSCRCYLILLFFLHKKFNTPPCSLVLHRVPTCTESGEMSWPMHSSLLLQLPGGNPGSLNHAQLTKLGEACQCIRKSASACQSQHTQQYICSRLDGYSEYQVMISPAAFQGSLSGSITHITLRTSLVKGMAFSPARV